MKRIPVLGIAIGGTKTAVTHAFYDGDFTDIKKIVFPTDKEPISIMEHIFSAINILKEPFDYISVICGGPLDVSKGIIQSPPHLPFFTNFPIVDILKDRYHCDVFLLNDADACALAEYKFGAGKNSKNMAFITFGTGLGAGLILNGNLFTGNNGMAGEIGHIRLSEDGPVGYGKEGSAEGYCAGGNIPLWAKEYIKNKETSLSKYETFTVKEIAFEARNNDKVSKEILDIVATKLGQTISVLIDSLNLDLVVIGGIYPRISDLLDETLFDSIKKETLKANLKVCKIVPSLLKEQIDEYSSLVGILLGDNMKTLYEKYPELIPQKENIESAIDTLEACYKNGGKILVCGNGGSASDAAHIVGELMKGFMDKRPLDQESFTKISKEFDGDEIGLKLQRGIPCIDLGAQGSLITAFANDVDPDLIFAQQVVAYSSKSLFDVVIGLSTSGNSKNVVNAIKVAKSLGLKTISLTGEKESKLSKSSSICIKAPASETFAIQEYHLPIYHYICMELEKRI